MPETNIQSAIRFLDCVILKDFDEVMVFFAQDAVLVDPHYPSKRMQGSAEIAEGMRWGFRSLKKFGFEIIDTYLSADGKGVVISVITAHELPNGKPLNFPQLLMFEFEGQKIKSLQAYVQYEPHGMGGLMLKITRVKAVLVGWKNQFTNKLYNEWLVVDIPLATSHGCEHATFLWS